MVNCSLLTSVLVAIIVVAASGHQDEKLYNCCKSVGTTEITEPIISYQIQKLNPPCVKAVIFTTKNGHYCSHLSAPWVFRKIREFMRAKAPSSTLQVVVSSPSPSSSSSLLSIITSTASPPSSSTLTSFSSSPSFFSSTSTITASETFSGATDQ
ncbi:hypothetical protein XENOCAPTIV_014487 [Xenoophorus captivus]|uniref:Chemokine interleukin-8-like domain-containing protein n=1 Tax=Xenoophorus captivus TaxID=1517983 RepID=A0ABV0QIC8_9TELE